jgi:hypothetical protein
MRIIWALVGVGGLAPGAVGQSLQFTTILSGDAIPGAPGTGQLIDVGQVVLQDDGAVAALTRFRSATGPTIPAVTFNPTPGDSAAKIVAHKGQTLFGGSGGTFEEFANLSSIDGNVTFIAEAQSTANLGLFRYAYTAGLETRTPIHLEGGAIDGHASSLETGGFTPTAYGVNGAGRLAFGAVTVPPATSPGTQFVARWDGSGGAPIRSVDGASGLTNINEPSFSRTFLTASDTTVFIAHTSAGRGIYAIDSAAGAAPVERVGAGVTIGGDAYAPMRVVGATGSGAGGSTLLFASKNPAPSDESNQALLLRFGGDGSTQELGSYDFDPPSGPPAIGFDAGAMMSTAGRVAALIPDADGGRAIYHDGTPSGAVESIAEVGTSVGGGFSITSLSPYSAAPMINDNGVVVFDATIADGTNDPVNALIAWAPHLGGPFVVVKAGDTVDVDGTPRIVSSVIPNIPAPANILGYDAEVLKDGLNEQNQLAFAILYMNGASAEFAVLRTELPEPNAILLAPLGAAGLLARRRKSWKFAKD